MAVLAKIIVVSFTFSTKEHKNSSRIGSSVNSLGDIFLSICVKEETKYMKEKEKGIICNI